MPVEIILRRMWMSGGDGGDELNQDTFVSIDGSVTMKPPVQLTYAKIKVKNEKKTSVS
jgi:hypothetical protein